KAQSTGSFVIRNPNNSTIHYEVKWGNGPWQSHTMYAYQKKAHSHPLDAWGRAPVPEVRFDYITGDPYVTYKTYRMEFYAVWDVWAGKSYVFRYSPPFVDLLAE